MGDPIEVGALGTAIRRAIAAQQAAATAKEGHSALALGSAKSCFGHTEGAAGLTGVLFALQELSQHLRPAVMNLRNTNPYIQAAFTDWKKSHRLTASVPRCNAPSSSDSSNARVVGTSSFGMSGVNAHAILSHAEPAEAPRQQISSVTWQRARTWPVMRPFALVPSVAVGTTGGPTFAIGFPPPEQALLRSLLQYGRPHVGLANMLEIAASCLALSQTDGSGLSNRTAIFTSGLLTAALDLTHGNRPRADPSGLGSPSLTCRLDQQEGWLAIQSPGGRHFIGHVGTAWHELGKRARGAVSRGFVHSRVVDRIVAPHCLRCYKSMRNGNAGIQGDFAKLADQGRTPGYILHPPAVESAWQIGAASRDPGRAAVAVACTGLLAVFGGNSAVQIPEFACAEKSRGSAGEGSVGSFSITGPHARPLTRFQGVTFRSLPWTAPFGEPDPPPLALEWRRIAAGRFKEPGAVLSWVFLSNTHVDLAAVLRQDTGSVRCVILVYSDSHNGVAVREGDVVRCGPCSVQDALKAASPDHVFVLSALPPGPGNFWPLTPRSHTWASDGFGRTCTRLVSSSAKAEFRYPGFRYPGFRRLQRRERVC